jgi:hypothetical protein
VIPDFQDDGNLPPGVHKASLTEVKNALTWNGVRKAFYLGLTRALENLAGAGVKRVWIGGSFVTSEEYPNDVDGCWEYDNSVAVLLLDDVFLDLNPPRAAMRKKYSVDFLIAGTRLQDGQARGGTVQDFFQEDRDGNPRGILIIDL